MKEIRLFLNVLNKWLSNCWFYLEILAHKGYSQTILFFLAVFESIFFPIPPDILLISLGISNRSKIWLFFLVCTFGSVIGACISYGIGSLLWGTVTDPSSLALFFFEKIPGFSKENYELVASLLRKYDFWVIFIVGFTPLPFKVITIMAGICKLDFLFFVLAAFVGRGGRFYLVSLALKLWGEQARQIIKKNLNWISLLLVMIVLSVFLLYKIFF